tara:strand:+ start:10249 stop:10476 length:228 start_codon:yes stop_codon:yes gene_type:complete
MNDKIINPESGRPVKILGKIGQRILGNLYRQTGGKSDSSKKKNKPKKPRSKNTNKKSKSISKKSSIDKHIQQLFH